MLEIGKVYKSKYRNIIMQCLSESEGSYEGILLDCDLSLDLVVGTNYPMNTVGWLPALSDAEASKYLKNCEKEAYDFVNPTHYKQNGVEVIEMMEMVWGVEKLIAHCEMCSFKYRMRLGLKPDQPIERDLEKALWYENKANELRKKC